MSEKTRSIYREYAESFIIALILALIIRTFLVQLFKIPSGSMEDTLLVGDHPLVNKFVYGLKVPITGDRVFSIRDPQRGDVVVFKFPKNYQFDFIKRVVGVPGDEIRVVNKQLYVNGKPDENPHAVHKDMEVVQACAPAPWPPATEFEESLCLRDNFGPVRVPVNSYFVMGDNRDRSRDSRFWGVVRKEELKGMAFLKLWSMDGAFWNLRWGRLFKKID